MDPEEIRSARENISDLRHVDLSMVLKEIKTVSGEQNELRAE
jgi:hypothetical protein